MIIRPPAAGKVNFAEYAGCDSQTPCKKRPLPTYSRGVVRATLRLFLKQTAKD